MHTLRNLFNFDFKDFFVSLVLTGVKRLSIFTALLQCITLYIFTDDLIWKHIFLYIIMTHLSCVSDTDGLFYRNTLFYY